MVRSQFRKLFWNQGCDVVYNLPAGFYISNFCVFHSALMYSAMFLLLRHWGRPRQHARQWGDPCGHRCRIKAAQSGGINTRKKFGEKCQNIFCIFSLVPRTVWRLSAGLRTFVWRENVQSVGVQQWRLLQISCSHGLNKFWFDRIW